MFSISSKHAASHLRPYLVPLHRRRLLALSGRCANHSSAEDNTNAAHLRKNDPEISPNSDYTSPRKRLRQSHRFQKILDVESLGNPGRILVLPYNRRRPSKVLRDDQKESNNSSIRKISFLPTKQDEKSTIFVSILDEIRSSHSAGDVLTREEWADLREKIKKGFTLGQLSYYVSKFSQLHTPSKTGNDSDTVNINDIWQAGDYFERSAENDAYQSSKNVKPAKKGRKTSFDKATYAERVLRDCWQLENADLTGRLEIRLPSQAVALLLSSDESWFEELSHSHDVKIEPFSSLNLICVYGTRDACESVRDIVNSHCSNIRTESMDLPSLQKLEMDKLGNTKNNFLTWLSKAHGVFIRDQGRNTAASVTYFEGNENGPVKARRDLEYANFITSAKTVPFCTYVPSDIAGFMESGSFKRLETPSQLDRSNSWTRWSIPYSSIDARDSTPPLFKEHSPKLSTEILQVLTGSTSHSYQHESPDHEETLKASIGQCLFQSKTENDSTHLNASSLGELSLPRIWQASLPKWITFLEYLRSFPGEEKLDNTHQFRMIPCGQNSHKLPVLEVTVTYHRMMGPVPISKIQLKGVKAIVDESSIDHLLPECNHDIRFTRTLAHNLLGATSGPEDPLYITLLSQLQETISRPNRPFPLTCEVPLPRSSLRNISASEAQSDSDVTEGESDTIIGKYWFPGVKSFQGTRVKSYDFMGEKLSHKYVEGGPLSLWKDDNIYLQMLVNRAPLSSSPVPPNVQAESSNSAENILDQEFLSFYRTSCHLAFLLSQHLERRTI